VTIVDTLFCALLFAHCLADYPLQGDFLARAKNHKAPIAGVPWPIALAAHAIIHAGFVAIITGSVVLGALEYVAHNIIDFAKSEGWLGPAERSFVIDQLLHIVCKALWVTLLLHGIR
jgi:hypothetical protein